MSGSIIKVRKGMRPKSSSGGGKTRPSGRQAGEQNSKKTY
jgi:hypothetical protein